jgi:ribosome maturation factor RimP
MGEERQISKTNRLETEIISRISRLIEGLSLELWDVVWIPNQRVLRVFIGKPHSEQAVTHADCERASRAIESVIESEGEVLPGLGQNYHLELSSLGTHPMIRVESQLMRFLNQNLEFVDMKGKKFTAKVLGVAADGTLEWAEESSGIRSQYSSIRDFQRIRVKKAQF